MNYDKSFFTTQKRAKKKPFKDHNLQNLSRKFSFICICSVILPSQVFLDSLGGIYEELMERQKVRLSLRAFEAPHLYPNHLLWANFKTFVVFLFEALQERY